MENEENIQSAQQGEFYQAQEFAKSTSLEDIRVGEWFVKLLHSGAKEVSGEGKCCLLSRKVSCGHLPPDAIDR